MTSSEKHTTDETTETNRIEAFSDGVFAIAITLLVLDIHVPRDLANHVSLLSALLSQWPTYLAFLTSFAFIGIMWINHHRLFSLIQRADHELLVLNLLLLLGVTVVPFPTSLLAAYIQTPEQHVAAMVYSGTYIVIAIFFNMLWRHASHQNRLLDPATDPESVGTISRGYNLGLLLYLITFVLAIVSVPASLVMNLALALYFALPSRSQRAIHGA